MRIRARGRSEGGLAAILVVSTPRPVEQEPTGVLDGGGRMRIVSSLLVAASAIVGLAVPSDAAPLPIRNASLSVRISDLAEFEIPRRPGPSLLVVNGMRTETQLLQIALPQSLFTLSTIATPIDVDPVQGLGLSSVWNDTGSFTGAGGSLAGPMAIRGFAWVCLLNPCDFGSVPDPAISLPLDVVGAGGSVSEDLGFLQVTLLGAPWTTGPVEVGSDMETGSIGAAPGDDGFLAVRLVTPIRLETNLEPPNDLIPAFGILTFEVPEPGTLALGLAAVGTLTAVGVSRVRHRR